MTRTLDPVAHATRRDEFIDAAQRLMATRGYEQLSVQDVLDELGASKGAFYHYFASKHALLEALVERMTDVALAALAPLIEDSGLPALQKLQRLFAQIASWKRERKDLVFGLMRIWYSDDNAVVRDKFRTSMVPRLGPLLEAIVRQGNAEGVFTAGAPEHTAGVIVSLIQGANEKAGYLFLARQANTISFEEVEGALSAYAEALERVLGVPHGSLPILDSETFHFWFD